MFNWRKPASQQTLKFAMQQHKNKQLKHLQPGSGFLSGWY